MNRVLILVALCALTAAMVPRERRAVDLDNVNDEAPQTTTKRPDGKTFCADATPCGWALYTMHNSLIESHLTNDYCQCKVNTTCQIDQDDPTASAFVKKCKPPSADGES